jgi:hypothetical protein
MGTALVRWYDRKGLSRIDPPLLEYVARAAQQYKPGPSRYGRGLLCAACQRVFVISRLFVLSFPHSVVPSSRAAVYVRLVRSARRRVTAMRGTSEDDRSAKTGPGPVSIMG